MLTELSNNEMNMVSGGRGETKCNWTKKSPD